MIISCPSCNKKFEIDSNLIGYKGRLVQCGNCENQWFFKPSILKETIKKKPEVKKNEEIKIPEKKEVKVNEIKIENKDINKSKTKKELVIKKELNQKKINFFKMFIVIIISMIALLIIVDTFKNVFSQLIPGIDMILDNLYETLKDMSLFFKDLIR